LPSSPIVLVLVLVLVIVSCLGLPPLARGAKIEDENENEDD
jgi:hypothetical protein